jgi:hypothetical protein
VAVNGQRLAHVHDLGLGHDAVRDDEVVLLADELEPHRAPAHLLDLPGELAHLDPVARLERALQHQRQPGEQVRQRLLQGKAEDDRERGGRGDEGRDIHAEARAEQDHQDEAADDGGDDVANDGRGLPRPARAREEIEDHDLHDLEGAVREREEPEERR